MRHVSQKAFAEMLGLSSRQISNLRAKGMPAHAKGNGHEYPIPDAVQWYVRFKEEAAATEARPADLDEAKLRLETAKAEMAELELAERRRQLVTVERYVAEQADAFARVRARLDVLLVRLGRAVELETPEARRREVQLAHDEVVAELYAAEDVPVEDDVDESDDEEAA